MYPWNCCRLCLSTDYLNPIFSIPEKHEKYTRILLDSCGVQVQINDKYSQQICTTCVTNVNENYKFRKKCAETQKTLKARLENGEFFIKSEFELKCEGSANIDISNANDNICDDILDNCNNIDNLLNDIDQTDLSNAKFEIHKYLKPGNEINNDYIQIKDSIIGDFKDNINGNVIEDTKQKLDNVNNEREVTNRRSKRNVKKRIEIVDDMSVDDAFCDDNDDSEDYGEHTVHKDIKKFTKISKGKALKKEKCDRIKKRNKRENETKKDPEREPVECEYCHKKLSSRLSIPNHYKIHTGFNIVCEHCGKKFISRRILLMHCRARHGYEKTDKCQYCEYRASNADQVKIHERLHTGEKPFVCKDCGAAFIRSSTYKQHIATHLTEKNVQCDQCPALFKSVTLMKIHKNKHKPNQYVFKCRVCNNSFVRRRNVTRHLERIHKLQPEPGLLERVRIGSSELDTS